jgi:hypothetical protein
MQASTVPGGAGRMLASQSGLLVRRRRGAVVIIAPLSRTALASSGDAWTSCTMVWARAWLCVVGLWLVSFGSWSDGGEGACGGALFDVSGRWGWGAVVGVVTGRGCGAILWI